MLLSVGRPLPRLLPRAQHRPPRVHPLMPLPLEPSQPAQRHGRAHDATRHAAAQPAAAAIILPAGPRVDLGGELGRQQRAPQPQDDGENRRRCGRGRRERAADPMIAIYRIVTARECCRVACARLFNRSTSLVFEGNRPASVAEEAPVSTCACTCTCTCQVHRRDHRKSGYLRSQSAGVRGLHYSNLHSSLCTRPRAPLVSSNSSYTVYSTPPPFQLVLRVHLFLSPTTTLASLHVHTSSRLASHPHPSSHYPLSNHPPLQYPNPPHPYRAAAQSHAIPQSAPTTHGCPGHPGGSHPTAELTTVC